MRTKDFGVWIRPRRQGPGAEGQLLMVNGFFQKISSHHVDRLRYPTGRHRVDIDNKPQCVFNSPETRYVCSPRIMVLLIQTQESCKGGDLHRETC